MACPRQHLTGTINNGATQAYAFDVRAGSRLYYFSVTSNTGQSISSITDTQGNTWTQVEDVTVGSFRFEVWKATAGSTGANTITANFSSFVSAPRIWLAEVVPHGTLTDGASDTHDQTAGQDPMTLASLTAGGDGLAFVIVITDTTHTFNGFLAFPFQDMNGGTTSRMGFAPIASGESVAPTIDFAASETGESLLIELYDDVSSGSPGGSPGSPSAEEVSHVFVG